MKTVKEMESELEQAAIDFMHKFNIEDKLIIPENGTPGNGHKLHRYLALFAARRQETIMKEVKKAMKDTKETFLHRERS